MHKFTNKKLPATFNNFFISFTKILLHYARNSTKPNQYFIPFFHTLAYELNVQLNLEVQRLKTPSLMT